jgi:hypothetical protein
MSLEINRLKGESLGASLGRVEVELKNLVEYPESSPPPIY